MARELNITLKIWDNAFSISISPLEEEIYRRAEKELNALADDYQKSYRGVDDRRARTMAALAVCVEKVKSEFKPKTEEEDKLLIEMEQKLNAALKK